MTDTGLTNRWTMKDVEAMLQPGGLVSGVNTLVLQQLLATMQENERMRSALRRFEQMGGCIGKVASDALSNEV